MNPLRDSSDGISLQLNRQLDALCDEFEGQLMAEELPPLSGYLDRIPLSVRHKLLKELVDMAIETLQKRGSSDPAEELVATNPELAEDLYEVYATLTKRADAAPTALYSPTAPQQNFLTPRKKRSRGMHIRCPHCSNHVELIGDTPHDEINCSTCGSSISLVDRSKETRMAQALQQIDRFELVSRLGVGGFGTVWKARDVELDRAVAVKIPRHGQLTADEMEGFFREARSVAQLRHPNIVPVHEVGQEGDTVFIVSDLIRGVSLADLLTGKQFSPSEAAEMVIIIADALEHAHRRGVIHRDLKPSNIMIDDDDKPHLMDFGLAKREAEEVTMTTDGQIVGTPTHMSPEQADGKSAWVDRRTDVYSLGIILFELLTGELPFRGNAQMQVRSRLNDDAPNARTLIRHLPEDLATICAKCLEREPGRRYQTAQEVGDELRRYLNKEPIEARPLSPIGRAARWVERRPLQAFTVCLIAVLAIGGPASAIIIEQQRSRAQKLADSYENLITKRAAEQQDAGKRAADLEERLELETRGTDPWNLWPPTRELSPKKQSLISLLDSRRDELLGLPRDELEAPIHASRRLITLAILQQEADRDPSALRSLKAAAKVLRSLNDENPEDLRFVLALADVYNRASAIESDSEAATEWLERASDLLASACRDWPDNPLCQAVFMEVQFRLASRAGRGGGAPYIESVMETQQNLPRIWPSDLAKLYELTCRIAGAPAYLSEQTFDDRP